MARPWAPVDVAVRSNEGIKIRRQDDREQHGGQQRQDAYDGVSLAVQDVEWQDGRVSQQDAQHTTQQEVKRVGDRCNARHETRKQDEYTANVQFLNMR